MRTIRPIRNVTTPGAGVVTALAAPRDIARSEAVAPVPYGRRTGVG
jgi:hypothetical protein